MDNPLPVGSIVQGLAVPLTFLIGLVLSLVEFSKKVGAKGPLCLILALIFGLLLGGGYYLAAFGIPADIAGWFLLFVVALVPGLAASGVYDYSTGKFRGQGS
jgi:hypothetical protein